MVKYKQFESAMKAIKECRSWIDNVYKDYKITLLGTPIIDIINSYVNYLEASFDDIDGYVSWWIYNCEYGKYSATVVDPDGTERAIKTDKDLYDLLVRIKEERNGR